VIRSIGANGLNLLSKRELEVVQCVVQGLTNREIADRMGLSQHTIKNYLFRVFDKLGVSSRVELLFITLSQGSQKEESPVHDGSNTFAKVDSYDEPTLAFFGKAAERGIPAAQFLLAQAYLARQTGPDDLVKAYMWYLIATERISQARVDVTKQMTARQVDEAEQKANYWLARMAQPPASAAEDRSTRIAPLRRAV
jgi:DNA-binding CsgD family transcriptional regulator